jgi:uncharacterized protein (TIGR03083 family)
MQLQPVYGDRPVLVVDLPAPPGVHPAVAQRRRLQGLLAGFDDAAWQHASRCEGWTNQDVITHLTSTNQFWAFSIAAGQGGQPTEFLATFDPVSSPAQLVEDAGPVAPADTLAAFEASNEALLELVESLSEDDLQRTAESPAGHVPIEHVLDHALWDSWVHERDVLLPLGEAPVESADEVRTALRYAAALGPGFGIMFGVDPVGPTVVEADDLGERFVVAVEDGQVRLHDGPAPDGAAAITGDAVELVELLSFRDTGTAAPPAVAALVAGLGQVFDQTVV